MKRKTISHLFLLIPVLLLIAGCAEKQTYTADPNQLVQADQDFSAMSVDSGMIKAFVHFAHPEAVLLRQNSMPISGIEAISTRLGEIPDSSFSLKWTPDYADIAQSGDLGYTFGKWFMEANDSLLSVGTYVSVWKRDSTGMWKWILDTGNEGLGEKD